MRVTFAGVGEAFDETLANTSLLVQCGDFSALLDCGFTAASAFWAVAENPLELDALYITHFHGDHYFGIPALLVRSVEEGRTKRLTIMGQPGIEDRVRRLMEMAYSNALRNAQFDIYFIECTSGDDLSLFGTRFRFAMNDHLMPCLAVRLDCEGKSVFYSGDGRPTEWTRDLAKGCNLVVHESASFEADVPGHGTIASSIEFARTLGAESLALVHVKRDVRKKNMQEIMETIGSVSDLNVFLPEPGEIIQL